MNVQNFRYMPERTNFEIYCLRWSECVNDMQMTHAAAYVFVNNYFPESTENAVSLHGKETWKKNYYENTTLY